MNYDRLLTRVWDKQEKVMLYKHQKFVYDGVWYVFESVTNDAVIASEYDPLSICQIICLELEDRFVPMMCEASKDKNGKLLYEDDIFLRFDMDKEQHMFICKYKDSGLTAFSIEKKAGVIIHVCSAYGVGIGRSEIIGNIHENEKLMEVKA